MPGKAGICQPDMLAPLVPDVRDQQDLGVAWKQVFLDDVDLEFAKPAAEFDLLLARQDLPAKNNNDVVVKSTLDFPKHLLVDILCEIVGDFGTASSTALRHGWLHSSLPHIRHNQHRNRGQCAPSARHLHLFLKQIASDVGWSMSDQSGRWRRSCWRSPTDQFAILLPES